MARCPICNHMVDPGDAERHAAHHIRMGEVGQKTTIKLLTMAIRLGDNRNESEGNHDQDHSAN